MKSKIQVTLRILALAAMVLFISACSNSITKPYGGADEAELLSLTIGNLAFTAEELPAAIDNTLWDFSGYDLYSQMAFVTAEFMRESEVTDIRIRPVISPRAWAEWGIGSRSAGPDVFYPAGIPATFSTEDYVYIKVQSESGVNTKYYRFYARVFSSVTHLFGLTIDDRKANVETGGSEWDNAKLGDISIRAKQWTGATINFETFDAKASIKFAKVLEADADTTPPDFTNAASLQFGESTSMDFADQDLLYAQVTAHNTIDTAIYKFRVSVGRLASIKTLTLIDTETGPTKKDIEVVGKGSPGTVWPASVPAGSKDTPTLAGSVETAKYDPATYTIKVDLDDEDASHKIVQIPAAIPSTEPTTWDVLGVDDVLTFALGNSLAIKVTSENGKGTMFYKIAVNLLAAEFEEQPLSDYYYYYDGDTMVGPGKKGTGSINWYTYVGLEKKPSHTNFATKGIAQVAPLTFKLDRPLPGATYQWYEANSWYGGYGFDRDGKISYAMPDGTEDTEVGFTADPTTAPAQYYREGLDEKKNVSLHNGGNNYYLLPYGGRTISAADGGTGETYTPKITYRPFLQGFTSEAHYYWVVITDPATQRKVTSKRAVIVSERDPDKAHYIVNLNAYLDKTGATNGLLANPKNTIPFKAGNHGDKYSMPMKFPAGFDIMNYSVVTAQALFFLADGRAWIQNWTQGDFGFENADGERLVLWYNLTNDNATRGLNGTGNDPVGGGLIENPGIFIVQPAGTKALDRLPPFLSNGQPQNTGDAQGWFTPFIEICELRFEGPGRK